MTSEILERKPPFDMDAERGVLGSMMLNADVGDDALLILKPDDFYDDGHRKLFQYLAAEALAGRRFDPTVAIDKLRPNGDLDIIGGPVAMASIFQSVPNAAHIGYYARIVRSKAIYRESIHAATEVLRDAYEEMEEADRIVETAGEKFFSIAERTVTAEPIDGGQLFDRQLNIIEDRQKGIAEHGIKTGYSDLDKKTGGLLNGDLIIVAARPSMGKSAITMNIVENVAIHDGLPVLVFSLEMSAVALADRMLSSLANVDAFRMRNGSLSPDEKRKVVDAAMTINRSKLMVHDASSIRVSGIAAHARRIKRKHGLRLLVVDYLQLIDADDHKVPREQQVAKMSKGLKSLAKELNVPVIVVAQLNRQSEQSGGGGKPKLHNLRESGSIEQDADVVLFIHRDDYGVVKPTDEQRGRAAIIIAKQRNGPTGETGVVWRKEVVRFENMAAKDLQNYCHAMADFNEPESEQEREF